MIFCGKSIIPMEFLWSQLKSSQIWSFTSDQEIIPTWLKVWWEKDFGGQSQIVLKIAILHGVNLKVNQCSLVKEIY